MHDITSDHITVVFFCICRHEDKKKKEKKTYMNTRAEKIYAHKIL